MVMPRVVPSAEGTDVDADWPEDTTVVTVLVDPPEPDAITTATTAPAAAPNNAGRNVFRLRICLSLSVEALSGPLDGRSRRPRTPCQQS